MEVVLPDLERLETVDHGSIVTVGGRGEHDEAQADVGLPQRRVLVPGDSRELTPGEAEGTLGRGLHCVDVGVVVTIVGGVVGESECSAKDRTRLSRWMRCLEKEENLSVGWAWVFIKGEAGQLLLQIRSIHPV